MWYFQDAKNTMKIVLKMGEDYKERMKDPIQRPRRRFKSPAALVNLLYWYALTGARSQEAFLKPYPTFKILNDKGETRVYITHVNEKHKKANGLPSETTAIIPVFDEIEQKMWNQITGGGAQTAADTIFQYHNWKNHTNSNVCKIFKRNFKTTLINPKDKEVFRDIGITPHILRHMRSYDVLINHKLHKNRELVKAWFGWKGDKMIEYYTHVSDMLQVIDQEEMLRDLDVYKDEKGKPKDLPIELDKIFKQMKTHTLG